MKQLIPGYGGADPVRMREIRRIARKAERTGKFDTLFRKILSYSFVLRRLPMIFVPPKPDRAAARQLSGKGYLRQCIEQLILLAMFRQEPGAYYSYNLFMPERYARAGEFIDYRKHSFLNFLVNQKKTTILTEDKVRFADLCNENGLTTAPIIARLDPQSGSADALEKLLAPVAQTAGVFFKPRFGLRGGGAGKLQLGEQGVWLLKYAQGDEISGAWPETVKTLIERASEELIFQPLLKSHPDLQKFNPESVQSLRVVTFRDGDLVKPLLARMRMGVGNSLVDTSYAAIGVPVDLSTGKLMRGGRKQTSVLLGSITTFGPSDLPLEGFEVPFFDEVIKLAIGVHDAFPEIFSLGHDIFVLSDGPAVIETNHIWGDSQYALENGLGVNKTYIDRLIEIARNKGI